jgi:hypothetical protein
MFEVFAADQGGFVAYTLGDWKILSPLSGESSPNNNGVPVSPAIANSSCGGPSLNQLLVRSLQVVNWPGVSISPGSPNYYGSSACSGAYLVDVVGPGSGTGFVRVRWDDNLPTNATDCANARLLSYSWDNSTHVGVEDLASNGTWTGSACQISDIFNSPFGSGVTRRYAISARQGSHLRVVALITSTPN